MLIRLFGLVWRKAHLRIQDRLDDDEPTYILNSNSTMALMLMDNFQPSSEPQVSEGSVAQKVKDPVIVAKFRLTAQCMLNTEHTRILNFKGEGPLNRHSITFRNKHSKSIDVAMSFCSRFNRMSRYCSDV